MSVREQPTKVKMAIGIDNFREMREKQNYYVDKTRLITERRYQRMEYVRCGCRTGK